jgi:hypothetical protein
MTRVSAANLMAEVDDYGNPTLLQADEITPIDGTARTIVGADTIRKTDLGPVIPFNNAATAVLSIPSDAALELRPGKTVLTVWVQGSGVPTFAAAGGSGVVIRGTPPAGAAQYSFIVLVHTGVANTWAYA